MNIFLCNDKIITMNDCCIIKIKLQRLIYSFDFLLSNSNRDEF